MNRVATWAGLGTDVRDCENVNEVLKKAHLDYEVRKENMFTAGGIIIPDRQATVANIDGTDRVLGDVSKKYSVLQNYDAFDFVDNIHEELKFEKAGQTKSGMVYMIASLPQIEILDDAFTPYLIIQNGHNGRYSLKTTIAPLRIVCQNQFNYAFGNSDNNISILHSSNMEYRLNSAKTLLSETAHYMDMLRENAEILASEKLTMSPEKIIGEFFDLAKKDNASKSVIEKIEANKAQMISVYNAEDNQNFKGTVWGLVNAFSDFNTHKEVKKTSNADETKFMSVTFDPRVMSKFIEFAESRAAA